VIDTHAHLEEIENLEQVIDDAKQAGIDAIVAVGSDMESNEMVLRLSESYKRFVYPALGWHPSYVNKLALDLNLEFIESHIDKAVAIGEIGLDYHKKVREKADKDLQKEVLREILKVARAHEKPVIIHSRYAWRDALTLVEETQLENAVFHWYTGTTSVLRDIVNGGYYISATPAVEYHDEHRRAVKEAPLERLLLETDCPVTYQRGSASEFEARPVDVLRSLKGAARVKEVTETEIAEVTTLNARRLFGIGQQATCYSG
jgi:TatD DNase family protein